VESVLSDLVGPVLELRPVERGYTPAERAVAVLADGRSVFVKQAINPHVTDRLRVEHRMYEHLEGQPFLAELISWRDGDEPILVLEDLSSCVWPPPWNPVRVDAVLSTLLSVTACEPPRDLKPFADMPYAVGNWAEVLADPDPFLTLGLCDPRWLDRYGPVLRDAANAAPLEGFALLHCDVRSDNICFRAGDALLIDWDCACIGNPAIDVAFWLPSLASENGPPPSEVMPGCPRELVAFVAGFFAARAGLPPISDAPGVRGVQLSQLRPALRWAIEALGLAD
jgi:hypothetical protein